MTKDNQKMVEGVQLILKQMPEISIMLGNCHKLTLTFQLSKDGVLTG